MDRLQFDVAVVGGSFAGLTAALQLGRARRQVVVIDSGQPRNRFAEHSHGFLSRDGSSPGEILAIAREQLAAYPTVRFLDGRASYAEAEDGIFRVSLRDGSEVLGRRLILSYGVKDILPDIPGLQEIWGRSAFHCPYCHAYEFRDQPLAMIADGDSAIHRALILPDWSRDVILFTNGPTVLDETQRAMIEQRGVVIEETPVAELAVESNALKAVVLADGRAIDRTGVLVGTQFEPTCAIHEDLGCEVEEGIAGPMIKVDDRKHTSRAGVLAAGDVARAMHNVASAVADGAVAGAMAHWSIVEEDARLTQLSVSK